jgi:hypothetical protein
MPFKKLDAKSIFKNYLGKASKVSEFLFSKNSKAMVRICIAGSDISGN